MSDVIKVLRFMIINKIDKADNSMSIIKIALGSSVSQSQTRKIILTFENLGAVKIGRLDRNAKTYYFTDDWINIGNCRSKKIIEKDR